MMLGPVAVFVALLAAYGWETVEVVREREAEGSVPVSWAALAVLGAPVLFLGVLAAANPRGLTNFALLEWYPAGWPRQPDPALAGPLRANGLFLLAGFGVAWGTAWAVARGWTGRLALVPLLLLAVADLWRVDARYLEVQDASVLEADPVIATLIRDMEPGERAWAPSLAGPRPNYRPNRLVYHGIPSVAGRQKFLLEPYARLVGGIQPDRELLQRPTLLSLFDASWLITPGAQEGIDPVADADERYLYRLSRFGHAWFPAEIVVASDTAEARERTLEIRDPRARAVVEVEGPGPAPSAGRGSATIARYEPDRIEFDVVAEKPGLLVVSEIHHPGWEARVGDTEVPVWRANTAFRAVEVPAGEHRVTFVYRSVPFRLGVASSLFALLGTVAAVGLVGRRRQLARDATS